MPTPHELTYSADLKEWINAIIADGGSAFSHATCEETADGSPRRADILLYRGGAVHSIISVKRPGLSILDEDVVGDAGRYAEDYHARYYLTHNVNFIALWDGTTHRVVEQFPITHVNDLEEYRSREDEIRQAVSAFLRWFEDYLTQGRAPRPLDESTADVLCAHVNGILVSTPLVPAIEDLVIADPEHRSAFDAWVLEVGLSPADSEAGLTDQVRTLCKQFLYGLLNRLMFYSVLKRQYPQISQMEFPEDCRDDRLFYGLLDNYFRRAKEISGDYETVFDGGAIAELPLPEPTLRGILQMAETVRSFDYLALGHDVLGSIFEKLIERDERHVLGQFFTPAYIADVLVAFAVRSPEARVLDPSAGSGTFLVRAYEAAASAVPDASHEALLQRVWGVEIAAFPAHLSTINLAIRDLTSHANYPSVVHADFFDIEGSEADVVIGPHGGQQTLALGFSTVAATEALDDEIVNRSVPVMDAVVGNPPYTRHEELHEEIFGEDYKSKLLRRVQADFPGYSFDGRAPIYAYFIPHALAFLRQDGGRLGFVTLSQWLDVAYGNELKKFMSEQTRIIAIVESPNERWFPDPQMLPILVLLQRLPHEEAPDGWVRFVRLEQPLQQAIPDLTRDRLQRARRQDRVQSVVASITGEGDEGEAETMTTGEGRELRLVQSDSMSVVMRRQSDLRPEEKWGKYLRAPKAYFAVLNDHANLLCRLEDVTASIGRGVKTGGNRFFCLRNAANPFVVTSPTEEAGRYRLQSEQHGEFEIEEEFIRDCISKIRPFDSIRITAGNDLLLDVANPPDPASMVAEYVAWGERPIHPIRRELKGYHETATCANRNPWHRLPVPREGAPQIVSPMIFWARYRVFWNEAQAIPTNCLHEVHVDDDVDPLLLVALLNSTFVALTMEFSGRYIENRDRTISNQVSTQDIRLLEIPDPRLVPQEVASDLKSAVERLWDRDAGPLWEEIDKPDRRALDDLVLAGLFGLAPAQVTDLLSQTAQLYRMRVARGSDASM